MTGARTTSPGVQAACARPGPCVPAALLTHSPRSSMASPRRVPQTAPAAKHGLTGCRISHASFPSPPDCETSLVSAGSRPRIGPWGGSSPRRREPWPRTVRVARIETRSRVGGTLLVFRGTARIVVHSLSHFVFEKGSHCDVKDGLELFILQSPLECWNYRRARSSWIFFFFFVVLRYLCLLSRHSTS